MPSEVPPIHFIDPIIPRLHYARSLPEIGDCVYNVTEPKMACHLENLKATGASIIAIGNLGCLAWIRQGAKEQGIHVHICHPVELLDEAYAP